MPRPPLSSRDRAQFRHKKNSFIIAPKTRLTTPSTGGHDPDQRLALIFSCCAMAAYYPYPPLYFQATFTNLPNHQTCCFHSLSLPLLLASASAGGLPDHPGALYSQCDMDSTCDFPCFCDAQLHICPPRRFSTPETISRLGEPAKHASLGYTRRSLEGSGD
jgi:hypothetical protein